MNWAFLVGRVILGLYFVWSGLGHFAAFGSYSGFAAARGVPAPGVAVIVSGLLLLTAGVSFLLGWRPRIGVAASILFFVPVTFIMHQFWAVPDPGMRMMELVNFTKNMAILAATLMFRAIPEPWPMSLDARLRTRVRPLQPREV